MTETMFMFAERIGIPGTVLLLVAVVMLKLLRKFTDRHVALVEQLQKTDQQRVQIDRRNSRTWRRMARVVEASDRASEARHAELLRAIDRQTSTSQRENG